MNISQGGSSSTSLSWVERIIVKFYFTNENRVPPGIRQVERMTDAEIDALHAKENPETALKGRLRFGRVDTGYQFIKDLQPTGASILPAQLAKEGYLSVDIHTFMKEGRAKRTKSGAYEPSAPKHVVVITFQKRDDDEIMPIDLNLNKEQSKILAKLFNGGNTSWVLHGFKNPHAKNITLNFTRITQEVPAFTLVTDNGKLFVEDNNQQVKDHYYNQ